MGRVKQIAARSFAVVARGLARVLPVGALYWVLIPYSLARGLSPARSALPYPVRRLPTKSGDRQPGFLARWRFQASLHQRWLLLFWSDQWTKPRWRDRFTAEGWAPIAELSAERPIVIVTIHTAPMVLLGPWLMANGLGVGSVVIDPRVWDQTKRAREELSRRSDAGFADSEAFLVGDARGLLRYLKPGRCLFLPADHLQGHTVDGTWDGGRLRIANGAFRIAKMTKSAVVPVIVTEDGRWRFRVHAGTPLPDELIVAGDEEAAATHIARQLMPIAVRYPGLAAETLVAAALPPE